MSYRLRSKKTKRLILQCVILATVVAIGTAAIWLQHQRQITAKQAEQTEQTKKLKEASDLKLIQACQDEVIARKAQFLASSQSFSAAEIRYAENTFDQQYKQCDTEPTVNPLGL
jgi:uncharacterized protein HemX